MRHWADSTRHWSIMFMKCILYPWWKEMAVKGRTGNDDGDDACADKLALDNMGWSRTERKSCFPIIIYFIYLFIYFKICTYRIYTGVRTKGYSIPYKVQPPKCMWRHRRPLVTEINMAGYGDGRSTSSRDALSAVATRFTDGYFSLFAVWTIFRHIYFCHYRTMMTSETSENAIFVRLYFAQCNLMQTAQNMKPQRNVSKNITLALCRWFVSDVIAATLVDQNTNEKHLISNQLLL